MIAKELIVGLYKNETQKQNLSKVLKRYLIQVFHGDLVNPEIWLKLLVILSVMTHYLF